MVVPHQVEGEALLQPLLQLHHYLLPGGDPAVQVPSPPPWVLAEERISKTIQNMPERSPRKRAPLSERASIAAQDLRVIQRPSLELLMNLVQKFRR